MKSYKLLSVISIFTAAALSIVAVSCNKDLEISEQLVPLAPGNIDVDAGTWTPVMSYNLAVNPVPVPADITSPVYVAELASVADIQSHLTSAQRKAIEYWSGGGVLRWNQFLRELVSRFNLPPVPRADGTYPAPDANNPFSDPQFPFANPPYAARAYSYVSAAQYEALRATWAYKDQYKRPAPYKTDNTIKSLMPESDLPAYPSEEAVMAAVTAKMLEVLFPTAVEEIRKKAFEQRNVAIWSGKATASDVTAGVALGEAIVGAFTTRAGSDNMKFAVGNKVQWDALKTACEDRGEMPWITRETPARPPMLPLFGNVKAWFMSPGDIVAERPESCPLTNSDLMKTETAEVKYFSEHITRDRLAIVHKWADGAGTYTPPGHWNDIAAEYIRDAKFSEVRAARAFALLNMSLHDAAVGCWETKFFYFNPRPSQTDLSIKTITGIPNFPAYTSGHSTFSGSAATVLSYLFPNGEKYFNEQASEASMSRLYGAIHYRSDCEKGLLHGQRIASYTIGFAQQDGADQ
jgi:hypothetical protein